MYYGVLRVSGNDEFMRFLKTILKEYEASLINSKKQPIIQRFHYISSSPKELIAHITIQEYNCLAFFEFLSEIFPTLEMSLLLKEYDGYCREHFIWQAGIIIYEHRHYTEKTYRQEREEFAALTN
ncbi:hypothetical protein SAMN05880501_101150 [Ureibacillus xyleni]|uniref:Uncharacterized protein n=1 Tax=Ureibacillus xyleni TaxID=614648 RepID=A0A285R913_9BACL|nr:hypothetical protein [Ureibacillus xyleni]SOB90374.1 hypothetical protein SAMN05880501_101150 [Ureibacillus xyleni]